MKLAAIDIGTNSIHMVIVRVHQDRIFEIIDREKEMVFLGKKSLLQKRLTSEAIDRALVTLKTFRSLADSHSVDQILCTATSAVREAVNGKQFIRRVKEETGIDVRILPGFEEARLITLAVRDFVDLKDRRALIIDIGGGSMELIVADAQNIFFVRSIKAGVIRLTERFIDKDPPSCREVKKLRKWLKKKLEPLSRKIQDLSPDLVVGTSGTIQAIGEMISAKRKQKSSTIPVDEVEEINQTLQKSSLQERFKIPGLDKKRADQIVAGGILIQTVMEACRVNEMMLCDGALREGLIADFLLRQNPGIPAEMQARELRSKSVLNLIHRWEYDRNHARHTADLALQLFDALADQHGLGLWEREMLEYACLLHDIGRVISYPRHHKHGCYIVRNANLIGFQPREISVIAALVRYHRKKIPKTKHAALKGLSGAERKVVVFLSAILRIADALDRQHNQVITKIRAKQESPKHLTLLIYSNGNAPIPLRAAAERADLLEKVLRLRRIDFRLESDLTTVRLYKVLRHPRKIDSNQSVSCC